MWIRLKGTKNIEIRGENRVYHKGDWVNVSEQTALLWIGSGSAEVMDYNGEGFMGMEGGVVLLQRDQAAIETLAPFSDKLKVDVARPSLLWPKTMLWNPDAHIRPELIPIGFRLLDKWQIAIPLMDYEKLAKDVGSEGERKVTQEIIGDLRVPLYDTRMMFVKRTEDTRRMIEAWEVECCDGADHGLAFLRQLWAYKPLILALPVTWVNPDYQVWA